MAQPIQIEVVSESIIKPSCTTPESKKFIYLSMLDQMNFALSTPIILFFSNKDGGQDFSENSKRLKSSLAKTLDVFYPVAGTVTNNSVIDCNDRGVDYIEARVHCELSQLLSSPDMNTLEKLIPIDLNPTSAFTGAKIQSNFFSCGAVAIGVSLSPKIGDATALLSFIMVWATFSFDSNIEQLPNDLIPKFIGNSIIPSLDSSMNLSFLPAPPPPLSSPPHLSAPRKTLRLVFSQSKIDYLQQQGASDSIPRPSRVEAITAFLWKCFIASTKSKFNDIKSRTSVVSHAVNYRKRFNPPLQETVIGNLSGRYIAETKEINADMKQLIMLLRNGLNQTTNLISEVLRTGNILKTLLEHTGKYLGLYESNSVDFYNFRSLCGFPLYKANFGWGNPDWVIVTNPVLKNYILMTDTRDGNGVEAWVSLDEEDAHLLEKDEDLLSFALVNPPVNV